MFEDRLDAVGEASEAGGGAEGEAVVGQVHQVVDARADTAYETCGVA